MAKYSTVSLMIMTLPAMGTRTTITSAEYHAQLIRAESIIDARIARSYTLPVTPECATGDTCNVPILQTIATDLAIYRIMTQRIYSGEKRSESPWPDKFREAMDILENIATGKMDLVTSAGAVVSERSDNNTIETSADGYLPTFTEDDPDYQIVDSDKIDDTRDARDQFAA